MLFRSVVFGGMDMKPQTLELKRGVEVLVATPGRLLDHIEAKNVVLNQVEYVVLDEADRMLDLGFAEDLAEVNQLTVERHQTMMFSATFAPRIQQLAMRVMHDGGSGVHKVQIDNPQEKHANIKQVINFRASKRDLLTTCFCTSTSC